MTIGEEVRHLVLVQPMSGSPRVTLHPEGGEKGFTLLIGEPPVATAVQKGSELYVMYGAHAETTIIDSEGFEVVRGSYAIVPPGGGVTVEGSPHIIFIVRILKQIPRPRATQAMVEAPTNAHGTLGNLRCGKCDTAAPEDGVTVESFHSSGMHNVPKDLVGRVPQPTKEHVGNYHIFRCPNCGALNHHLEQWKFID